MKYWRGYLVAFIFGAMAYFLKAFGERFSALIDMVYPYVIRTAQNMLADWSAQVPYNLWQLLAVALGVIGLGSVVLMILLKWNPIQWAGWVLAAGAAIYALHTLVFGLNYYAGPLADDIRLEVVDYNLEELTDAAIYYRDKANQLASQVKRDSDGNVLFADFETLAQQAGNGFENLTYTYSYPVFAGSRLPVKELGWADMYTSMGITGFTMGITGEAAVNPQIPDVSLPFTMCHEMAHRMCIAAEDDANFAAYLACMANESVEFQYSAYFMAYRYCYNAMAGAGNESASAAAARVNNGVSELLYRDMTAYSQFFSSNRDDSATRFANAVNDTYLKTSGASEGIHSYGQVCDLLVAWHIQQVVLPSIAVEESPFDPLDESQVDLSGLVNARIPETTAPQEENNG